MKLDNVELNYLEDMNDIRHESIQNQLDRIERNGYEARRRPSWVGTLLFTNIIGIVLGFAILAVLLAGN